MAINWGLAQPHDIGGAFTNALLKGREMRRELDTRNAMTKILQGSSGGSVPAPTTAGAPVGAVPQLSPALQTPGIGDQHNREISGDPMGDAWNTLYANAPEVAVKLQGQMRDQAAETRKTKNEGLLQLGRLLNRATDETSYQQSLAAARQLGMDVSRAPANFDPNWVRQQSMIVSAFEKDGGQQISGLARELQDAGYQPGTKGFQDAMYAAISGKYGLEYMDDQGNMRRRSLPMPTVPQQEPPQPQAGNIPPRLTNEPLDFTAYQGSVQTLGKAEADAFLQRNKVVVRVQSPEQANELPSGTVFITPDGRRKVKP